MFTRSHGAREPITIVLSPAAEALFDLRIDPAQDDVLDARVLESGAWWALPFATDQSGTIYAVRLLPGVPPTECPVVAVKGDEAVTLAPRPAFFLPVLLVERWLARRSRRWEIALTESAWSELAAVHGSLGGTDGLQAARGVLEDDALFRACHEGVTRRVARAEARERVDPSPEREVCDRYVLDAIEDDEARVPPPEAGCWNAALASLAFVTNRQERFRGLRALAEIGAAWLMMGHPPGLDTARSAFPDDRMSGEGGRSRMLSLAAAETLVRRKSLAPPEWTRHPLWRAVEALALAGPSFDGAACRTAAASLALQRKPREVLNALAAASFWGVRGARSAEVLAAGLELARDQGWRDLAEHLDRLGHLLRRAAEPPVPQRSPAVLVADAAQIFDVATAEDDERDNIATFADLPATAVSIVATESETRAPSSVAPRSKRRRP